MSNETPDGEERGRGMLTTADREFLQASDEERASEYSRQARSAAWKRIRERVQNGLRDFRLLARQLPEAEREKIFPGEPGSRERLYVDEDVMSAIDFMYTGLGGVTGFSRPMKMGVANGELQLGTVTSALQVTVRFEVGQSQFVELKEAAKLVEQGEWDRLTSPDLFTFVRSAHRMGAIDFEKFYQSRERQEWSAKYALGKKRKGIPGGKATPLMDLDVFEEWGIGEMSGEELRELFGEGYPATSFGAVFDGEKVFRPPPIGSDEDPEVIEWIAKEPTSDEE